jgi:hypothetical protein
MCTFSTITWEFVFSIQTIGSDVEDWFPSMAQSLITYGSTCDPEPRRTPFAAVKFPLLSMWMEACDSSFEGSVRPYPGGAPIAPFGLGPEEELGMADEVKVENEGERSRIMPVGL